MDNLSVKIGFSSILRNIHGVLTKKKLGIYPSFSCYYLVTFLITILLFQICLWSPRSP